MPPQRARGAESRVGNKLSNGPRRAQSKAMPSILRRRAYVSCRGYVGIPLSVRLTAVNQGGTADRLGFALDRRRFCRGRFVLSPAYIRRRWYGAADETMAKAADDLT